MTSISGHAGTTKAAGGPLRMLARFVRRMKQELGLTRLLSGLFAYKSFMPRSPLI